MIIFRLFKFRFISTLVTLLMTLQMSACGTEEFLTAVAPDLGSGSIPVTEAVNNHAAIITGDNNGSVTEDIDLNNGQLETGGTLTITDLDAGEDTFISKTINGSYGKLIINAAGNWIYAADNSQTAIQNLVAGKTLTDSLIINSADGTPHIIAITILGADENNATANITLSWNAPVQREDNSTLAANEIKKYTIHYGTTSGQHTEQSIAFEATTYTITGLPVGTYYFVLTTTDTDGRVSAYSEEVAITI